METARVLAKQLRDEGADLVVAVTHQREPNDFKLANNLPHLEAVSQEPGPFEMRICRSDQAEES
jgi:2',3'-cyclic-nucleotide 2'-phosphodiesterase (5'-nucleotidase family)